MKKQLFVSLLLVALFAQQAFAGNLGVGETFSDVKSGHPYAYQIDWLADNGVVRGYDGDTFQPEKCVNRAEFLKMMYATREADVSVPYPAAMYMFGDVDLKAWYWPYLRYAIMNNTVQGYSDHTFRPGQCVNRVEAVKMAVLEFHDGKVPQPWGALQPNLVDVAPNAWYSPMMEYAYDAHVLGMAHVQSVRENPPADFDVKYFPDQGMTRGEVAYMLYMLKALVDNGVAAHDSSIWANGKKNVLYNEERGVLMPKRLADAYTFDGCGKMSDLYAKEPWYTQWKKIVTEKGIDVTKIADACFSDEGQVVIFLLDGEYGEVFKVYKYDIKSSTLAQATLNCKGNPCAANGSDFGKRRGNFISITGEIGDAGGGTQSDFEYYFDKNVLELKRSRSISFDEHVGGTPTAPIYTGSGERIYGPWQNY